MHALDPVLAVYVPARQLEQLVENDAEDAYFPYEQLEQAVDKATEYEPDAHAPVTAERPAVAQYEPAVQAVHALAPFVVMKVPARQLEQVVANAAE